MIRGDIGSCQNMRKALRDGQKLGRKFTGQVFRKASWRKHIGRKRETYN